MNKAIGEISQLIDEHRAHLKSANEALAVGQALVQDLIILIAKAEIMRELATVQGMAERERIERLINAGRPSGSN